MLPNRLTRLGPVVKRNARQVVQSYGEIAPVAATGPQAVRSGDSADHHTYRQCMTTSEARHVSPATDQDRAIATLTIAFSSDPVARWFLSDPGRYLTYWAPFVRALAGEAFANGTADSIAGCGGVALWLPPDVGSDDEAMAAIATEAVPEPDQEEVFSVLGQMGDYHPSVIGTCP